MHSPEVSANPLLPERRDDDVRHATPSALAAALTASRRDTLATFAVCEQALRALSVPQRAALNPPLWELGHIGWFHEFWIARNPQRAAGADADPLAPRHPGVRANADALYDSSAVPHATRWSLPLPDADATRADLAAQLAQTLALLSNADDDDAALYFYRLALLHEDMHHEAALYMAQSLGIAVGDARWQAERLPEARASVALDAGPWSLGSVAEGFAFDNELRAHPVELPATQIDSRVLTWAEYLPFAEAGGYAQPQWWSDAAATRLVAEKITSPRYTRRLGHVWQQWRHGEWAALDMAHAACHLTLFEAEAWCRWAGRRLPTEAEWERAALARPAAFAWGQVWEWTASEFAAYPGFVPHTYRDYSAPWFCGHRVLRGASFMTQPRLRNARYRNFFMPHRNDVSAGFRTCAQ